MGRKYATPLEGASARVGDDLHEWFESIYRQNLTTSIANSVLPGAVHSPALPRNGHKRGGSELPFGDFAMEASSVEAVMRRARGEELPMPSGDVYLRFGLPRVALPQGSDGYGLYQQGSNFREVQSRRKAASELDLRRSGLQGSSIHPGGGSMSVLDQQPSPSIRSEAGAKDVFDVSDFAPMAAGRFRGGPEQGLYEGGFLSSKRHHGHYFSNAELHASAPPLPPSANYLRYAKADELSHPVSKMPHLCLRNFGFQRDRRSFADSLLLRSPDYESVLSGLCLDAYGGQTLALLYSDEEEAKILFRVLSSSRRLKGRREGSVRVNGIPLGRRGLWSRVAYVEAEGEEAAALSVKESLRLSAALLRPASKAFRSEAMIAQLIQTLALGPYQDRLVAELGRTERLRLKVASKILLDTEILLLDDVIRGMDLYDAAFLLDYLRDWAGKLNRIVIAAANAPTAQLLAMFHKAAVLASGRLLFVGGTAELQPYFSALDYPCPLFKNPCDYYVDLVTLDELTLEAGAESAERIRRLADLWATTISFILGSNGEAPPPGGLGVLGRSSKAALSRLNPVAVIPVLYWRHWLLMLNAGWDVGRELLLALLCSLWLGCVYFNLTLGHQGGIRDRFGLLSCFTSAAAVPTLAVNVDRIFRERPILLRDLRSQLYSRPSYLAAKLLFDLPLSVLSATALLLPAYLLAGLQPPGTDQGVSVGLLLLSGGLHLHFWRYLAWAVAFACPSRASAGFLLGSAFGLSVLLSGFGLHPLDMWAPVAYASWLSPTRWALGLAAKRELLGNGTAAFGAPAPGAPLTELAFKCEAKTILENRQGFEIQTARRCNATLGSSLWAASALEPPLRVAASDLRRFYVPLGLGFLGLLALLAFFLSCCCAYCQHRPRQKLRRRR